MSDSARPHRPQATGLPSPWDSPGKNTGVGCHFLLQYMKVKSESEDAQSCRTPSDPMDCSLPGSSIHGICQAGVLEWVAIAFSCPASCPSYCKQCFNEHWCTGVSFNSGFLGVYAQRWDCWQFYFQFLKESPHCSP